MSRWIVFTILSIVVCFRAPRSEAQPTPTHPAFEVASIKLNKSCDPGGGRPRILPGRLNLPCVSVRALIRIAYGAAFIGSNLNSSRIEVLGGPGWLDTERHDIAAKPEGSTAPADLTGPMLRALPEDRCQIRIHKESRDTPVYDLTVVKSSANLRQAKEGDCTPIDLGNLPGPALRPGDPATKYCGAGRMKGNAGSVIADWYGVSMAEFAGRMLSSYLDRPVIDKTGLTGRFDIHLEFVPEIPMPGGPVRLNGVDVPASAIPAESSGPSIFNALRTQLGLGLSPGKSPVEAVIVDHVERPSGN